MITLAALIFSGSLALAESLLPGIGYLQPRVDAGAPPGVDDLFYEKLDTFDVLPGSQAKFAGNQVHFTELVSQECGYELKCLVVLQWKHQKHMNQVRVKDKEGKSVWIRVPTSFVYIPYVTFVKSAMLTYHGPTRVIRTSPAGLKSPSWLAEKAPKIAATKNVQLTVLETKIVASKVWLKVRFELLDNPCGVNETGERLGEGWIPLFHSPTESTVHHFPRGC